MTTAGETNSDESLENETPPLRKLVQAGGLLCQRFRIKNQLGTPGTIAFSMRATDGLTDEEVVCKIPCRAENALFQNLIDQYRFMRNLRSPRMPAVLGYFREELPTNGQSFPFLVMELVHGEEAETWRRGQPIRARLRMFLDVVDTIADLNDKGVEHGDVHLGNILVDAKGRGVLIDPDSQCLGSTFTDRVKTDGSKVDLKCLQRCLEQLVEDENPNVVAGLLERLGRDDLKVPTARELGVVLRAILASKLLPGQSIETLEDAASRYKDESTASIGMYRRNCQLRDMEFRRLRDLLSAMAEKYGFKVVTNLERRSLGLDSVVKPEEDSESTPHGRFETRNLTCSTLDGDCLHLRFDGVPQFRRPWPDVTGLLSKGLLSVVFQGAPSAILLRPLELWFSGMDTILGSREPDRFAYLEAGDFEHALRVLSGDIYPGVPEPVVVPRKHSSSDASKLSAQYRALQKHEIPFAKPGRGKADKGMPHRH